MIDRRRLLRYGMNQLSAWLPALLMMLFALATWWLVRSAPRIVASPGQTPVSAEPDYFMHDFSVRVFDPTGQLQSELKGVEGHHFPINDTLEVTQPHILSYDQQGHPTVATALRGVSNADGSDVKLYGNAHVVRDPVTRDNGSVIPRMEFRGEFLHAFVNEKRVLSDQPVELRRGDDVFTGDVFDYNDKTGIAHLQGRVRGTLQPQPSSPSHPKARQPAGKRPQASTAAPAKAKTKKKRR